MEMRGPHISRLEVFNMCFDYDVGDRCTEFIAYNSKDRHIAWRFSLNEVIETPGHFRGRIFVGNNDAIEDFDFTEIYNSDTVGSLYVDLPKEMKDDDSEDSQKRAKQNNGDSASRDTEEMQVPDGFPKSSGASTVNFPHTGPNEDEEEEEMQVAHEFPKSSRNLFNLPLMGPNKGMILDESFFVVIHNDTGDRNAEELYDQMAFTEYSRRRFIHPDDVGVWRGLMLSNYDRPFEFHICNDFRKLKMNCMVMKNTKVVDVSIKWCMPTSYICGEISVSCDKFLGNKCYLIQTPHKKFVMAKEGEFIKLCRFTVAVPYSSDFTVSAMLHDLNNALLVNESVSFPFVPFFNKDPEKHSYTSMLPMVGITGGRIEVVAFVYL